MDEKSYTLPKKHISLSSNNNKDASRPSSYYDNYKENDQSEINKYKRRLSDEVELKNMANVENAHENSPTQEYLLKTTVPQNMTGINIAGKHTPTRNSLRHSRMIVMNRADPLVPRAYISNVHNHKLAITLAAIQIVLGATLCCLAAWLLLWAPNLRKRDNPYWSGLPLLACGTFTLFLLCSCKKAHSHTLRGYLIRGCHVLSIILGLAAAALTLIACVFAIIHLTTLSIMECDSNQFLNETCVCKINSNSTYPVKSYHYLDLRCPQVNETLFTLLTTSAVINGFAGFICLWYVYLHCSTKKEYSYLKVKTKTEEKHKYILKSNNI